jgi:hypothetical protein
MLATPPVPLHANYSPKAAIPRSLRECAAKSFSWSIPTTGLLRSARSSFRALRRLHHPLAGAAAARGGWPALVHSPFGSTQEGCCVFGVFASHLSPSGRPQTRSSGFSPGCSCATGAYVRLTRLQHAHATDPQTSVATSIIRSNFRHWHPSGMATWSRPPKPH